MPLTHILPIVAVIFVALTMIVVARIATPHGGTKISQNLWVIPAILSVLFLGWSVAAILTEGPFGFWPEHIRNMWGNQIWFDLILAVLVGWTFMVPKAKHMGMSLPFWYIFVLATASIGLTAMMARIFYLQSRLPEHQ